VSVPRAGLNTTEVVRAGADLADEAGIASVTLAVLAARLGVKAPALYKHVDGITDLQRRIATLAMVELGDALREALQGQAGADAIRALFTTVQDYISRHPGRYSATTGVAFLDGDDPLREAGDRIMESCRAAVSSYGIQPDEIDHAIRVLRCTFHGYALLQAGDAFQWANDRDESVAWMIRFVDAGLKEVGAGR
jgi:AcrR family transcriptional regulator